MKNFLFAAGSVLQLGTPAAGLLATLILWVLSRSNYLLYHVIIEEISIIIAVLIFTLATRTHKYSTNYFLLFVGNAYLFVAFLDFFHLPTYKGIGHPSILLG